LQFTHECTIQALNTIEQKSAKITELESHHEQQLARHAATKAQLLEHARTFMATFTKVIEE